MRKEELQEHVAELTLELRSARRKERVLSARNRRLARALRAERARFERLADYVSTLRRWAAERGRPTVEGVKTDDA